MSTIHVSAITLIASVYLIEKRRFRESTLDPQIQFVNARSEGNVLAPITSDVSRAIRQVPRKLVPDMRDRLIAARAVHLGFPLVTADSQIHSYGTVVIG